MAVLGPGHSRSSGTHSALPKGGHESLFFIGPSAPAPFRESPAASRGAARPGRTYPPPGGVPRAVE